MRFLELRNPDNRARRSPPSEKRFSLVIPEHQITPSEQLFWKTRSGLVLLQKRSLYVIFTFSIEGLVDFFLYRVSIRLPTRGVDPRQQYDPAELLLLDPGSMSVGANEKVNSPVKRCKT